MLTEKTARRAEQGQADYSEYATVGIKDVPVMQSALDVVSLLGKSHGVVISAKGNSIPNAVAVTNIITEKMLAGNSKVQKITLDTDAAPGIGKMLSTIEIVLCKT